MKIAILGLLTLTFTFSHSASALEMRKDPRTGEVFFLLPGPVQKQVDIAWKLPAQFAKADGTYDNFDFTKIANDDQEYVDANLNAIEENAVNILIDVKAGSIIETLDNFKKDYRGCFRVASYGMNHCSLNVTYDAKSQFAVATIDGKWDTASIAVLKLKEQKDGLHVAAQAFGVIQVLYNDILNTMDKKYSKNSSYKANRDGLVQVFTLDSVKMLYSDIDSFEARIVFNAESSVPKHDDFYSDDKLVYRIVAKQSNSLLSITKE